MSLLFPDSDKFFNAGMDESGRGCLFGPVVAAIVILPKNFIELSKQEKVIIRDSKKMTMLQKKKSREFIEKHALDYNVQFVDHEHINKNGIMKSTMQCMNNCVQNLKIKPLTLHVDGNFYENHHPEIHYECIVKGDNNPLYPEIACASILAKTHRDEYMLQLANDHSEWNEKYDIGHNKGYGTKKMIEGIKSFGLSELHRTHFCKHFI